MTHAESILTLNAGSSSLKFALFEADADPRLLLNGEIENLKASPHLKALDPSGAILSERRWPAGESPSFAIVLDVLLEFTSQYLGSSDLVAVDHRIVHGGAAHIEPALVTPDLLAAFDRLIPLDPLHLPHNLSPIHAVAAARPILMQVACFDTAFHHTMPPEATALALPASVSDGGIRRFGFHGLSYEYISGELRLEAPGEPCFDQDDPAL